MYTVTQLAKKYFRYYITASSSKGHAVHSPFVFDFIKFVKNDAKHYDCYRLVESVRKQLLSNAGLIEVQDFGAGSTVIKTSKRNVNKIAASSLKPRKFSQLLFRIVQYYQPATILELGTSFGISTAYLSLGNPRGQVYTMEGAPAIAQIAQQNFEALGLKNIELVSGDFTQTLPALLSRAGRIDLAFIDGNHRKLPTLDYFRQLLDHSTDHSIFIFDDIHWSHEMEEAWEAIKAHPTVTLTIDLFFIGIVFLRKEFKVKQHFSIRF